MIFIGSGWMNIEKRRQRFKIVKTIGIYLSAGMPQNMPDYQINVTSGIHAGKKVLMKNLKESM